MQQDSLLSRQEAIDAQKTPSQGTVRLATSDSHQVWELTTAGIAAAILVWLFAGYYTGSEHVAGSLVPQADPLTVTARSAGTVTSIAVAEGGAAVHAGEALLTVSDDHSSATVGDSSAVIRTWLALREQLNADMLVAFDQSG